MNLNPSGVSPRLALIPGPDRKRTPQLYNYRLTHLNADPATIGCILLWEVTGGRLDYQIAIERDAGGNLIPHCTCADSIFRAEEEGRFCKHIRALLDLESENNRGLLSIGA